MGDDYIKAKVEPFLHGVPISFALIVGITSLIGENNNSGQLNCDRPEYRPPHCIGFEDGEVREGFDIPCGRGYDGAPGFVTMSALIVLFVPPIISGISLGMMYRTVSRQERQMERYGAGALNLSRNNEDTNVDSINSNRGFRRLRSVGNSISRWFSPGSIREDSNSQRILHQAMAYTSAYFLTWIWWVIIVTKYLAGATNEMWLVYLNNIFSPLQGVSNMTQIIIPSLFFHFIIPTSSVTH